MKMMLEDDGLMKIQVLVESPGTNIQDPILEEMNYVFPE